MPSHQDQPPAAAPRAAGLAVVDRHLSVIELDDRFAALGGAPAQAALGRPLAEALPLLAGALEPCLRRVLASGETLAELDLPGGPSAPPLRIACYPVRSRGGAVLAVDLVAQTPPADDAPPALDQGLLLDSALFRRLAAFVGGVFWISDPSRRTLLYASPAFEEIWGVALADLYADRGLWIAVIHPDDRARVEQAIPGQILADSYDVEYRVVRPDGAIRWIHDRAAALGGPGGPTRYVGGLAEDITARKRAEAALRDSEARFYTLAASLPQLIWTATPDGAVDFMSEQWRGYTGLDPDVLLGWGWQHITHPADVPRTSAAWREHLQSGAPVDLKHRFRHHSGEWRWQLVRALPFRDERGQITKWFGTCTDIHDQIVAVHDAQFLAELAEQIRVADDAQALFGAAMRRLGSYLDVARCYTTLIDEAADRVTIAHEYCPDGSPLAGAYRLSEYPAEVVAAARGGHTVRVEDTGTDPRTAPVRAAVFEPLGIRAYVVVPAMRAGGWAANLVVTADAPRVWQQREVALLETVAERLWLAGEKLRLDAALRASQADLALALQAGRAGTFTWDIQRDRNSWSPELEALYDLPPGSFGGDYRAWAARVVPEDVRMVELGLAAAINARQGAYAYEFRAVLPSGAWRWLAGRARFEYDSDGTPLRMRGINVDIHERKQAELNARFLLDLDALVAKQTDPEVIEQTGVDCLGAYLDVGRCYFGHIDDAANITVRCEWLRDEPRVCGVYRPDDYFSPEAIAQFQANIDCVVADVEADPRTAGKVAAYRALGIGAFVSVPVLYQGGLVGALNIASPGPRAWRPDEVWLLRDVAARIWPLLEQARVTQALRASEEQLQRLYAQEQAARAEAEEASRLKDEFLATLSHELRTPLTTVLGYGQLLQSRKRHEPDTLRVVGQIVQSARVQAQLIEDLLDVSRIVTGKLRLELRPLDLAPIVAAAVETVRPGLEAKGLRLDLRLDDAPPVSGDPTRLQQVVWNLVSNAVKFTPSGGRVVVRLGREGAAAQISVSDSGRGISPAFLPFVFERFRQADGTSSRQHSGLGLGLSIVRHLVELHGGAVAAASDGEGRGARFTVQLPGLARLAPTPADAFPDGAGLSDSGPAALAGLRVLVVDDQPEIGLMLGEVLAGGGALVEVCTAAREALARLEQWRPDLLVSDIAMPEQDGYWLIERLRALPPERGGAIPAVALTAYVRAEDRVRVLAAGFQRYVPKPVEPDELLAVLAGLAGDEELETWG